MSDKDKSLLLQLQERHQELLDEIAPAIESREKEREDFAARETELAGVATTAIEAITRDESKDAETKRAAVVEADKPLLDARAAFRAAEERFEADFKRREQEIKTHEQRISEQEVLEHRLEVAAQASTGETRVTSEPMTYRKDLNDRNVSYFRDLAVMQMPAVASRMGDPIAAKDRLEKHAREMDVEVPKRRQARERRAQEQVDRAEREFRGSFVNGVRRGSLDSSPFEHRVTPNRTDGQGGSTRKARIAA